MTKNIQGFIEELPLNLQSLVQLSIHQDLLQSCPFFRSKQYPASFFGWIGAHLKHESSSAGAVIYKEGDRIHEIFILQKGLAGYYL